MSKCFIARPSIYGELAPHGQEDWDKIGVFLREMVADEPPPAKKGVLEKYLKTTSLKYYDIRVLTSTDKQLTKSDVF